MIIMSEHIGELATALSKAQSVIEHVMRTRQAYGYKYAELCDCLQAVKKPLCDNGFAVSQPITTNDNGDKHFLETVLLHGSDQWIRSKLCVEQVVLKQCNSLQQLGAGITFTRRYALCALVGLAQEDDDAASIPKSGKEDKSNPAINSRVEINELIGLCNKHNIDIKEFARVNNIDSSKIESVRDAIFNFEIYKTAHGRALGQTIAK